jgi:hypothetical protein
VLRKIETCPLRITAESETPFMSASSIVPTTGTSPQQNPSRQADAREADNAPPKQAPPPPGMGKLVDKTV